MPSLLELHDPKATVKADDVEEEEVRDALISGEAGRA